MALANLQKITEETTEDGSGEPAEDDSEEPVKATERYQTAEDDSEELEKVTERYQTAEHNSGEPARQQRPTMQVAKMKDPSEV